MAVKSLEDLFTETLRDIYYAEKKLVSTLPKMAKMAQSPDLKQAMEKHLEETKTHVQRVEEIFEGLGKRASAKKCEAMDGIVSEAEEVASEVKAEEVVDAALISSAQTVEHYEIARYGTLCAWARELGMDDAEKLLQSTLEEEKAADEKLTMLAEEAVNQRAAA
ncbi:MAG: ferritin-like domain-containing protein [Hyphomicrobiales bacterium]